jgi:hypothetical protein
MVVHRGPKHDYPFLEQLGVDVEGPLAAARLLDDDGDEVAVHVAPSRSKLQPDGAT